MYSYKAFFDLAGDDYTLLRWKVFMQVLLLASLRVLW